MTATDIESLQARTGRCLHACLVTSVITLFVLLLGVTVSAALFIRQMQTELVTVTKATHELTEDMQSHASLVKHNYKNFAYLRAQTGQLGNVTMKWTKSSSELVGSGYNFFNTQHALQPVGEGSYLLYLNVVLHCIHSKLQDCGLASVTVKVKNQDSILLKCEMRLLQGAEEVRAENCWKMVQLGSQRLVVWMETHGATKSWKLDTEQSGMGMFLVDRRTVR